VQVTLDKRFALPGDADHAWGLLQDIPRVAACMPGAEITEVVDERHFKGRVKVKLGPVTMGFAGTIEVQELSAAERRITLLGKGSDPKGSSASMELRAGIDAADAGPQLAGTATVTINGQIVSLGGRMMNQVADRLLDQFGENFVAQLGPAQSAAAAAGETAPPRAAEPPRELNVLALLWGLLRAWFKRLLGRGSTT